MNFSDICSILQHLFMQDLITSTQNPSVKRILKLGKPGYRKEQHQFIIEGKREIERALQSGYTLDTLCLCPDIASDAAFIPEKWQAAHHLSMNRHVFSRIAYRDQSDGLLAVANMKKHGLDQYTPGSRPLILVVENVEKPGNLGALLRTADAVGVDAVFVCDNQTDIYNPNVVRSSLGCLFSNRIVIASSEEAISFFNQHQITMFAAVLQDSKDYYQVGFTGSSAIVLGSESHGLSEIWRTHASHRIKIPMAGIADSLNVSVSAAILLFEAVRQREAAHHGVNR